MKALVTGGLGFVGGSICRAFQRAGWEVRSIDDARRASVSSDGLKEFDYLNYEVGIGEIEAIHVVDGFKPDVIVHCAAYSMIEEAERCRMGYVHNNVIEHAKFLSGIPDLSRVIYSGTSGVYGEPETFPINEQHRIRPINWYSVTKWRAEQLLRTIAEAKDMSWLIFRYFSVTGVGWGVRENRPYDEHVVTKLMQCAAGGEEFTLNGNDYKTPDGSAIRDFVSVKDIARAHVLAAEALVKETIHSGEVVNLGTGSGVSMKTLALMVMAASGKEIKIKIGPRRNGDPSALVCDNKKAKSLLGWEPTENLQDEMVELWKARNGIGEAVS